MHQTATRKRKMLPAEEMHQPVPKKRKAPEAPPEPMTPTTPAPMTPRFPPIDRRSPTPSFGSPKPRFDNREKTEPKTNYGETKKTYGDWYRQQCYYPGHYMIDVCGHRVHAHSWWKLQSSSQYGKYYFINDYGESLWPSRY